MSVQHDEHHLTTGDGLRLFHRSDVPPNPSSAVMLYHGLGEHSGRYEHVIAALNEAGCAVYAIDHRGHGRSEGDRVFVRNYDEFMSDLAQYRTYVDAARGELPLFVLGHSMGGNLALGHALRNPGGIAGLALSGPALTPSDDVSPILERAVGVLGRLAPKFRPQALDAEAISRDPAVVAAYLDDPLVFTGKLTAGIGAALIGAMREFPSRYGELEMPVLLLHGTADALAPVEGSRELEARAINADVTSHYYDGLYHEVFNEPEQTAVLGDLTDWITAVRARDRG